MLQNKKINLLIAFSLALILWFYINGTVSQDTTKKFSDIKVNFINQNSLIESGYAIESAEYKTIDVTVAGNRSLISNLKEEDIKVTADVYSRYKGKNYVNLDVELPKGIRVENKSANKILVEIGTATEEEKTIEAVVEGEMPQGNVLGHTDIEPKTVKVKGTKNNVANVLNVKASLDGAKLTSEKTSHQSKLIAVDKNGKEVDYIVLSVDDVSVTSYLEKYKSVPLNVIITGQVDSKYEVESMNKPDTIEIQGSEKDLKNIDKLTTQPIDIDRLKANAKIKIAPILPEGIRIKSGSEEPYLNIAIKQSVAKTFEFTPSDISVRKLSKNKKIILENKKISVKVIANKKHNTDITKNDVKLYIDYEPSLKAGDKVEIKGEVSGDYTLEISPNKILVEHLEE